MSRQAGQGITLDSADLRRLCALLSGRSGMALPETRWPFVESRAGAVMARARIASGRDLLERLAADPTESEQLYAALEQALWIHETSFFRYPEHHRILRETALPGILRGRDPASPVRILSAGCSTGEEAYSIVMTAQEALAPPYRVEVLGADASRDALATARRATYPPGRLAQVPALYLKKYFLAGDGAAGLRIGPTCRAGAQFLYHNIRTGAYLGKFDAAFCCNVLLYFTPATKEQVLIWLALSLQRGGWLFLGHAEGVVPPRQWFRAARLSAAGVYQRI